MTITRRQLLLTGAALAGTYAAASYFPALAAPEQQDRLRSQFMQLSRLLVNHQLNPGVGARIVANAAGVHSNLSDMLTSIIAVAQQKKAATVEDFFEDIPDGALKDLSHWIIFAWYSGMSSAKHDGKVFTYEEALTYQVTKDVVAIPSFGLAGPDLWRQETVPLENMSVF